MNEWPSGLIPWISQHTGCAQEQIALSLVAGDASPRRYYRVTGWKSDERIRAGGSRPRADSLMAMVAPPTENNEAFLHVGARMAEVGVHTPAVWAKSVDEGWFLLEDFGDQQLLMSLRALPAVSLQASATQLYSEACRALLRQITLPIEKAGIPIYDAQQLQTELDVFLEWFVTGLLHLEVEASVQRGYTALSKDLIASALAQPTVWVHRDFHSRNLMTLDDGELGVIDFQDAVLGPITYDPVSLFKDCYIRWPREQQLIWLDSYLDRVKRALLDPFSVSGPSRREPLPHDAKTTTQPLDETESVSARFGNVTDEQSSNTPLSPQHLKNLHQQLINVSPQQFQHWFDLMGLQRHLKVLGVFARLHLRDHKSGYLDDLPLVVEYVREALVLMEHTYESVAAFRTWFDGQVMPAIVKQPWYRPVSSQDRVS